MQISGRHPPHASSSSPPIPGVPLHANLDDSFPRQSLFHVDCLKCAKCTNRMAADTDRLLLLADRSLICANCSYRCDMCKLPIVDEAIIDAAGEHSYHVHCFKCRLCEKRIDELVFAKTSRGIHCMDCQNERVERGRRHQEKKQEREGEEAAFKLQKLEEEERTAEVRSRL